MIKFAIVTILLASTALGFVPAPMVRAPFVVHSAVEEETSDAAPPAPTTFKASFAKGELASLNKKIAKADGASFAAVAKEIEGIVAEKAGRNYLAKARRRLANQAKALDIDFKAADWGTGAKCVAARRAKQDAYVKSKIEEVKAAEEEVSLCPSPSDEPRIILAFPNLCLSSLSFDRPPGRSRRLPLWPRRRSPLPRNRHISCLTMVFGFRIQ